MDRALERQPTNAAGLETKALICLELDRTAEARDLLLQAVAADPDDGPAKYMYLGQLAAGREAVGFIEKGIAVMKQAIAEVWLAWAWLMPDAGGPGVPGGGAAAGLR